MDKKSMGELQEELNSIIDWFESGDVDIDQAEAQYKSGLELAQEIQKRLKQAENKITKLKQSFDENSV